MNIKAFFRIAICLASVQPLSSQAQHIISNVLKSKSDSATISLDKHTESYVDSSGDTLLLYKYNPIPISVSNSENASEDGIMSIDADACNEATDVLKPPPLRPFPVDAGFSYIPIDESISSTGARTYEIPIMTAANCKLTPQLSLSYNSQNGNGIAGYGWSLSGASVISAVGKNIFYDSVTTSCDLSNTSSIAFSLDGIRLVENLGKLNEYQYETAQGYILVKRHMNGDAVAYFTVAYPNGNKAIFGFQTNDTNQLIYPITELVDANGFRIDFAYEKTGNNYYLTKVQYGSTSKDSHPAEINFTYSNRQDITTAYLGGKAITLSKLLERIETSDQVNGTKTLMREYVFRHTTDGVSLLKSVECACGDKQIPPLTFEYGTAKDNFSAKLVKREECLLPKYFSTSKGEEFDYIRGKFIRNKYNDGMIVLPASFNSWTVVGTYVVNVLGSKFYYPAYGSDYPVGQTILIYPMLENISRVDSIKAEKGFQTIQAIDVDGNGADDIVKVNVIGYGKGYTQFKVTQYSYNNSSALSSKSFTFTINRAYNNGNDKYSPAKCSYLWGDFIGNGKAKLVVMSYDQNNENKAYFDMVDIEAKTLLGESLVVDDFNESAAFSLDIDGDGKTELCHTTKEGMYVYTFKSDKFEKLRFDNSINSTAFSNRTIVGDINGDGNADLLVAPLMSYEHFEHRKIPVWSKPVCPFCKCSEPTLDNRDVCRKCGENIKQYLIDNRHSLKCRVCEETLYIEKKGNIETPMCYEHGAMVERDICISSADNGNVWTLYTSTGCSFVKSEMNIIKYDEGSKFMLIDVDYDGCSDLICVNDTSIVLYINKNSLITGTPVCNIAISNNADVVPSNICSFRNMSNFITIDNAIAKSYGYTHNFSRANLLTLMADSYQRTHVNEYSNIIGNNENFFISATNTYSYPYTLLLQPFNILQYSRITRNNVTIANYSYRFYNAVCNNEGLGFMGFDKVATTDEMTRKTCTVTYDPKMFGVITCVDTPEKTQNMIYSCAINASKKHNPMLKSSTELDNATNTCISKNFWYDEYGNPVKIRTSYGSDLDVVQSMTYKTVMTQDCYLTGLPSLTKTVSTRDGKSWTTSEFVSYNENNLPLSRVKYVGNDKSSETRYTYDQYGNTISEKYAPYNVAEYIGSTFTYDAGGRHLVMSTDEQERKTIYSEYDMFGNPCKVTDFRNNITTYSYDVMGELEFVTYPDSSYESTTREWGGIGVYTFKKRVNGIHSETIHYDNFNREIRRGTVRLDGSWAYVDKTYNYDGNVCSISQPFTGDNPVAWNTYEYDSFGRPLAYKETSGKTTYWSYNGLCTTETKEGVTTKRTVDVVGRTVKVEDPGGQILYTYRPDGQVSEIIAPDGITTSLTYDNFGRKTAIDDPSFGIQTAAEVYASDGTRTIKTTDANGNVVKTLYNKFGQKTSEERPEFSTTYTYDSDGNIISEISSNGFISTCSYDNYGRLQQKTKSFGNKSITKTYAYTKDKLTKETITIETGIYQPKSFGIKYKYSYNCIKELSLDNNVPIWSISKINDFGQPTEVTTGEMSRFYDYATYGLPTRRRAGNVQDMTFRFDNLSGNLLSRTDNNHNLTEIFSYDKLNRLCAVNGNPIGYADNGNLTSMPQVGTFLYGNEDKPYAVTDFIQDNDVNGYIDDSDMYIEYNSLHRPKTIKNGEHNASFEYDASGNRIMMSVDSSDKIYLDEYETDGNIQILYLGGDAYSAPMACIKRIMSPSWTLVNICRDHIGSITQIASVDGRLIQEYSYDAWGNMRNPETNELYKEEWEKELYLGRGYTGHEHLNQFGLINMNARLYDSETGRFISPDIYVQMPDNTQSLNRYSYCLNNPLKYVDKDGNLFFLFTPFAMVYNTIYNVFAHGFNFGNYNWKVLSNSWKIDTGMFRGNAWQIFKKWTWGFPNSFIGNFTANALNAFWLVDKVTYLDGMAAIAAPKAVKGGGAFTIGYTSVGPKNYTADWRDHLFVHEYGHYIQSQHFGPLYLNVIATKSLMSAWFTSKASKMSHSERWFEVDASALGAKHFDKKYGTGAEGYQKGDSRFFDIDSFRGGTASPYTNPRLGNRTQLSSMKKSKLVWWDFFPFF